MLRLKSKRGETHRNLDRQPKEVLGAQDGGATDRGQGLLLRPAAQMDADTGLPALHQSRRVQGVVAHLLDLAGWRERFRRTLFRGLGPLLNEACVYMTLPSEPALPPLSRTRRAPSSPPQRPRSSLLRDRQLDWPWSLSTERGVRNPCGLQFLALQASRECNGPSHRSFGRAGTHARVIPMMMAMLNNGLLLSSDPQSTRLSHCHAMGKETAAMLAYARLLLLGAASHHLPY